MNRYEFNKSELTERHSQYIATAALHSGKMKPGRFTEATTRTAKK